LSLNRGALHSPDRPVKPPTTALVLVALILLLAVGILLAPTDVQSPQADGARPSRRLGRVELDAPTSAPPCSEYLGPDEDSAPEIMLAVTATP
jgi:hypothetical protein